MTSMTMQISEISHLFQRVFRRLQVSAMPKPTKNTSTRCYVLLCYVTLCYVMFRTHYIPKIERMYTIYILQVDNPPTRSTIHLAPQQPSNFQIIEPYLIVHPQPWIGYLYLCACNVYVQFDTPKKQLGVKRHPFFSWCRFALLNSRQTNAPLQLQRKIAKTATSLQGWWPS